MAGSRSPLYLLVAMRSGGSSNTGREIERGVERGRRNVEEEGSSTLTVNILLVVLCERIGTVT